MNTLYIKFSSDVCDLDFISTSASFVSDHAVSLVPIEIEGFEPVIEPGERTIEPTLLEPDTIFDEFECTHFRACIEEGSNPEKILLKFGFDDTSIEDFRLEARAYVRLKGLQGSIIPPFLGLYKVVDDPQTVCFITADVGDSITARYSPYLLPKEDRMKISRLLPHLCEYEVCLDRLQGHHILLGNNRYWLHNLSDIQNHTCSPGREPQEGGQTETDLILREFPCYLIQFELSQLRVWNWPRPNTVAIDNMAYSDVGYPSQALIDKLWLPMMEGSPVFFTNWYRDIKSFMDKEGLDPENEADMQRIVDFSEREKAQVLPIEGYSTRA